MSGVPTTVPIGRNFFDYFKLMLGHPPRQQIAALCYRKGKKGPEILLVTSRGTRRWILPKGWPLEKASYRKTAGTEAFEEAGIIGTVGKEALGEFISHKGIDSGFKLRTHVIVYPVQVEKQKKAFPERGEREMAWLPVGEAIERCSEPGLKAILSSEKVKTLLNSL